MEGDAGASQLNPTGVQSAQARLQRSDPGLCEQQRDRALQGVGRDPHQRTKHADHPAVGLGQEMNPLGIKRS